MAEPREEATEKRRLTGPSNKTEPREVFSDFTSPDFLSFIAYIPYRLWERISTVNSTCYEDGELLLGKERKVGAQAGECLGEILLGAVEVRGSKWNIRLFLDEEENSKGFFKNIYNDQKHRIVSRWKCGERMVAQNKVKSANKIGS